MFVRLWMTPEPLTLTGENSVAEAITLMQEKRVRRIPIVSQEQQLVGIVSKQDIANVMPSILDGSSAGVPETLAESTKLAEVMTANPIFTGPLTPLEEVALCMQKHKVGGLPVLDGKKLVGIISESDIQKALVEILGAGVDGVRLELAIGKDSSEFYRIFDIFKRYSIYTRNISLHHSFSGSKRLLTVKVQGTDIPAMLEALHTEGVQINSIQGIDDEEE